MKEEQTYLSVFIITVSGQKYFSHFVHAAEEQRELRLSTKTDNTSQTQHFFTVRCQLSWKAETTYILYHILLQVLNRLLFQGSL